MLTLLIQTITMAYYGTMVHLRAKEGGMEKTVFASAPFFSFPLATYASSPVICVGGRPIPIV